MNKYYRFAAFLAFLINISLFASEASKAQEKQATPELSVVGIELGNRESAKKYLLPGNIPRVEEDGRASYYFYNQWGTQVMRLTTPSVDELYLITEIEVFAVGKSYQKRHYQDEKNGLMMTENGIFIGFRQTAVNLIFGVRNAGKKNTIDPDGLVDVKGDPTTREKTGDDIEVLTYEIQAVKVADLESPIKYVGRYEFNKKEKLTRFSMKIILNGDSAARN